jgi:hypothetical protein
MGKCQWVLRTFLSSYFLPNCYRKNLGNPASAVVKLPAVVRLAQDLMGRAAKMGGRYDQTRPCRGNSAACRIGIVAVLSQNRCSAGGRGKQARARHEAHGPKPKQLGTSIMCNEHSGPADGGTRLSGIMEGEGTALDGTFLRRHCGN